MLRIQIDKNLPIPPRGHHKGDPNGGAYIWPWNYLEKGDSFLSPPGVKAPSVRTMAFLAARRLGHACVTRTVSKGRVRVWRTA